MASQQYRVVFEQYKSNIQGMREMMRTKAMQRCMLDHAEPIADAANALEHGRFAATPQHESVTSAIGAHAFVITADMYARHAEKKYDILNSVL